jgi:hypothetical protein
MRRLLLLAAVVCGSLVAAGTSNATPSLLVAGAGASTASGHVVINARAIGPATGSPPVFPAVGFLRARNSRFGDLSGSVTCIGLFTPSAVIVSGHLDTPVVSGGFTFPDFSLIVFSGGNDSPDWIRLFVGDLSSVPNAPCAESLFFLAGLPDLPNDHLVNGHFQILRGS